MPLLFVLVVAVLVNFPSSVLAQESTTKIRGPRSTDVPPAPLTVGPLSPSDTLWRVAERIKPEGNLSLYQVMYALYLKNPNAFLENNLNHLRPGAVLVLPSLQEMQQVDVNTARQKSEQDDKNWASRQKVAKTTSGAATKPAQPDDAEQQWQAELTKIGQQQRQDLDSLRSQFADSMQQVEAIVAENQQLKTSLTKVEQELALIRAQLGEDSELQQQITQLLAQQEELLRAKAEQEALAAETTDWQQWFKNPLAWILAACIPALLVLFSILLWIKKRSQHTEQVINAATTETVADPSYHSPLPPLDDSNELDESLFEIDDALLEDAFNDSNETAEPELADDMLEFDDSLSFEDDSLLPPDARTEAQAEPEEADIFDPDNILSDTDLSALLAAEDDDDVVIELAEDSLEFDGEATDTAPSAKAAPQPTQAEVADIDEPVLPDEFDIDELIEEIDLDEVDDPAAEAFPLQEQQLTQALAEVQSATEQHDKAFADSAQTSENPDSILADTPDIDSFDSSELEEFAESLVTENDSVSQRQLDDDLGNNEEALLSAELAELLDQVEDRIGLSQDATEPSAQLSEESDDTAPDELLDVTEPDGPDSILAALDLTASDDASVVQPTEAALSVENPSKILEQYPELELKDETATTDVSAGQAEPDELPGVLDDMQDRLADETAELELDPIPDAQFDSLMSELEAMADNLEATAQVAEQSEQAEVTAPPKDNDFDFADDDFVEIDSLLANAELQEQDTERFNQLNVDVGLEDYADIIGEHERRDVDSEDNGYSAKLDLVRAYIEIDDRESADLLLDDILASDAPEHVKTEAQRLR